MDQSYTLSVEASAAQEVPAYQSRFALVLIGSLAFVGLGVWLCMTPEGERERAIIKIATGIASILFFGLCAVFAAYKSFDQRPALTLTKRELINRSSMFAIRSVSWSEITSAEIVPFGMQRFLVLRVSNPRALLARQSIAVRAMQAANMALVGSPIVIAGTTLTMPLDDLLSAVNSRIADVASSHSSNPSH